MSGSGKYGEGKQRVASIMIGKGREVMMEDLLMKLALAESVVKEMATSLTDINECGGILVGDNTPPDNWAMIGASQNLNEISHALKALCWGHEEAYLH